LGFTGKYLIFDLPYLSALQQFYLRSLGIPVHSVESFKSAKSGVLCISELEQLAKVLSRNPAANHSLFIATWSISEAPIYVRESVLSLASQFYSYLIAYQAQFGEVNNIHFFYPGFVS
jgi:hypothetical protein